MNKTFKGLMGAALISASSLAVAVPLTGGISFSSLPGTSFTFDTDTNTFDFDNDVPGVTNASVNAVSGQFNNYFSSGDQVTFFDFTYDPFVGPQTIWSGQASVGGNAGTTLGFLLDNANVDFENDSTAIVSGVGTITDGVNEIDGIWNVSANKAGGALSWSSSTAVPEPATLALLGLGLLGLGVARCRQA